MDAVNCSSDLVGSRKANQLPIARLNWLLLKKNAQGDRVGGSYSCSGNGYFFPIVSKEPFNTSFEDRQVQLYLRLKTGQDCRLVLSCQLSFQGMCCSQVLGLKNKESGNLEQLSAIPSAATHHHVPVRELNSPLNDALSSTFKGRKLHFPRQRSGMFSCLMSSTAVSWQVKIQFCLHTVPEAVRLALPQSVFLWPGPFPSERWLLHPFLSSRVTYWNGFWAIIFNTSQ